MNNLPERVLSEFSTIEGKTYGKNHPSHPKSYGIHRRDELDRGQPTIHHSQTSYYRNWAPTCLYDSLSNTWLAQAGGLPRKWQFTYIITYHGTLRLYWTYIDAACDVASPTSFFYFCDANKYFRAKKLANACYLANSTMGCCSVKYEKSRGMILRSR